MSYKTILRKNFREDEQYFLVKKGLSEKEDILGFSQEKYIPIQELHGVIQKPQEQQIDFKGEESNPSYTGYFLPEFIIDTDEVADYRVKYVRPHETLLLKIAEYNPNLFLKGKRDHIQLEMLLEKKYTEKQ